MKANVLVIANRTAASPDLLAHLRDLDQPRAAGRAAAQANLDEALAACEREGLEATGSVGTDSDPVVAVIEAYDPARHDEIVVSTLPESASKWLGIDGPHRIGRATGALVHHVVSREPRPVPEPVHIERKKGPGVLAPLVALGYGRREVGS